MWPVSAPVITWMRACDASKPLLSRCNRAKPLRIITRMRNVSERDLRNAGGPGKEKSRRRRRVDIVETRASRYRAVICAAALAINLMRKLAMASVNRRKSE